MNQAEWLSDQQPGQQAFLQHVHEGLGSPQKWLSPMYFYDAAGSQLFDRICEQAEYYPTRTELEIMDTRLAEIVSAVGERALIIEPGSGSSLKTRTLLAALQHPAGYVPVEISREHLLDAVAVLRDCFPGLSILPVCADFTTPFDIPEPDSPPRKRVIFFPGSTIG
ncbi:MAG: L-histidine N(alpha)-methyltransferase, partial [Chromatocurvus sp.]